MAEVSDEFELGSGEPVEPAQAAVAIVDAPFTRPPRATPLAPYVFRKYVNDERNSRLPFALPSGRWQISRQVAARPSTSTPQALLLSADRVLLDRGEPWELFDTDLESLAGGYASAGSVTLDAEFNLIISPDAGGLMQVHHLADGGRAFAVSLDAGEEMIPSFVARRPRHLLVVSTETITDLHSDEEPEYSRIQIIELREPFRADPSGLAESAITAEDLMRRSLLLLPALHDETLTVTTEQRLYVIGPKLVFEGAFKENFVPLALSIDETCRAYVVASTPEGLALWVITRDGQRVVNAATPPDLLPLVAPPIVAHDHDIYLIGENRICRFAADGAPLWECRLETIAGATLAAGDDLLVSTGNELIAFDPEGIGRSLFEFAGESLCTPPVLTADGALIVAGNKHVFRLEVET